MVEYLLQKAADVNAPPAVNGGATALQLAAIQGSIKVVALLLDNGAKIDAPGAVVNGRTALEGAAEHGRLSVLDLFLRRDSSQCALEDIKSAKSYAEENCHEGCVERLRLAINRFSDGSDSRLLGL